MKLHNLSLQKAQHTKKKGLGRGEASGKGGTSTKGNKGGQSRAVIKSKDGARRWTDAYSASFSKAWI